MTERSRDLRQRLREIVTAKLNYQQSWDDNARNLYSDLMNDLIADIGAGLISMGPDRVELQDLTDQAIDLLLTALTMLADDHGATPEHYWGLIARSEAFDEGY